jgi:hypothetical protein
MHLLEITLQAFAHRRRVAPQHVIANIGLSDMDETLQELYAEDADWNYSFAD